MNQEKALYREFENNKMEEKENTKPKARQSWDDYFMNVAEVISNRSSCLTRSTGAVLVKGKQIISTGYNGTPKGLKHCDEGGCDRCAQKFDGKIKSGEELDKCVCCHAEENAIVQAALHGIRTEGATIYTTFTPCLHCAKMIINAGIKKVVAKEDYPDDIGTSLLKQAEIELVKFKKIQ